MFINSITLNLYIPQITLCHLSFPLSFIVFNHPGCEIFHVASHFAIQVSLIANSSFVDWLNIGWIDIVANKYDLATIYFLNVGKI